MQIPIADAPAFLADLARRVEAGEEVTLTRLGRDVVRLVAVRAVGEKPRSLSREERLAVIQEVRAFGRLYGTPGPDGARSQDFLYDDNGLPA